MTLCVSYMLDAAVGCAGWSFSRGRRDQELHSASGGRNVITELLRNILILRNRSSEQVSGLVCVAKNWWLIEHLICEVCVASDSRKGEIWKDTHHLVAIRLMNQRYFMLCVGFMLESRHYSISRCKLASFTLNGLTEFGVCGCICNIEFDCCRHCSFLAQ